MEGWKARANPPPRTTPKHLENVKKVFGKDQPRALLNVPESGTLFAMHGLCWDTRVVLVP